MTKTWPCPKPPLRLMNVETVGHEFRGSLIQSEAHKKSSACVRERDPSRSRSRMKPWSSPFHVKRCQVPPRARFTFTSSTTQPPVLQSLALLFHVKRSKVFPRPRFSFNSSTILTFIEKKQKIFQIKLFSFFHFFILFIK